MRKLGIFMFLLLGLFLSSCDIEGNIDDDIVDGIKNAIEDFNPDALDDIDDALKLVTGGSVEGSIKENGTMIYYFYLPSALEVVIDIESDFDSKVVVRNFETKAIVFDGDESIYGDVYTILSLEAGNYELEVSGFNSVAAGNFTVSIGTDDIFYDIELDQAKSMSIANDVVQGFLVEIETTGKYRIVSESELDLQGILSTLEGVFIDYSDDKSLEDEDFEIIVDLTPGKYVIGVRLFDISSAGDYNLLIEEVEEIEHKSSIEIDETISDILYSNEVNTLTFTLEESGTVNFEMGSGFDSYGRIYDENNMLLFEDDDSGEELDFNLNHYLEAGTYSIVITGLDEFEYGTYNLTFTFSVSTIPEVPDDTQSEQIIDINSYVTSSLDAFEEESFIFTLLEDTTLTMYTVSDADTVGVLYGIEGNYITENDTPLYRFDDNFLFDNITLSAGTYKLTVSEYYGDAIDTYEFHIWVSNYNLEYDDQTITNLYLDAFITSSIGFNANEKYAFTINEAQYLDIYSITNMQMVIYIYRSDGELYNYSYGDNGGFYFYNFYFEPDTYTVVIFESDGLLISSYELYIEAAD